MSDENKPGTPSPDEAKKEEATPAASEGEGKASAGPTPLADGLGGFVGIKAGMTTVFDEEGNAHAVTVIDLQPNVVTQIKTPEKDGYTAIQVGVVDKKTKHTSRPEKGRLKPLKRETGFAFYREFRLPKDSKMEGLVVGSELGPDFIADGDIVDISATSKGKGFQGVMKRWNFAGGPASHGASVVHRMPGSLSANRGNGLILKGKKMAGQMGNKRVTVQNVKVFKLDKENGILLLDGSVPGPKSGFVTIRKAIKKGAIQANAY